MRAYFFGNMYLSSIQQGIQSAHVVHELFTKYDEPGGPNYYSLREWAINHKTMILLNAGYSQELYDLIEFLDDLKNPYAWASFHEGDDALDGALTCVGLVLDEKIYGASRMLRGPDGREFAETVENEGYGIIVCDDGVSTREYDYSKFEYQLAQRLNKYGLAK